MAHDTDGPKKGETRFKDGRPVHSSEDEDDEDDNSEDE